jgi:hypothetical protein
METHRHHANKQTINEFPALRMFAQAAPAFAFICRLNKSVKRENDCMSRSLPHSTAAKHITDLDVSEDMKVLARRKVNPSETMMT